MRRAILFCALLIAVAAGAEEPYHKIEVKMSPEDGRVTLGGEIKLMVSVEHDTDTTLAPPAEPVPLEPFEFKRITRGSQKRSQDKLVESFTIICTIFDLGDFKIPGLSFYLVAADGKSAELRTSEIPITVVSVLKEPPEKAQLRPIKGPATIDRFSSYKALIWPAILVILLSILYFYLRSRARKLRKTQDLDEQMEATAEALAALRELRRRHKNIFEKAIPREEKPAYHFEKPDMEASEEAVVALLDLQNQKLITQGMVKQFHAELSHIFRHYLTRRYSIPTSEKTTSEVMALARYHGIPAQVLQWMQSILGRCDLVKFSPAQPSIDDCEQVWRECWDFVLQTRPPEKAEKQPIPARTSAA